MTVERLPYTMGEWITQWNLSPWMLLIAINVMVLVPILAPVTAAAGIDPIHFAMVVIFNLTLGMITPPVGGLLFVTSNVARIPLSALTRELKPFLIAHGVVLVMLTFIPQLSTWLP